MWVVFSSSSPYPFLLYDRGSLNQQQLNQTLDTPPVLFLKTCQLTVLTLSIFHYLVAHYIKLSVR